MTNKEAIITLKANYPDACFGQLREAVDAAINALNAQDDKRTETHACDCISRQTILDALDVIESEVADGEGFLYEKWREYFCDLPPAQPEKRTENTRKTHACDCISRQEVIDTVRKIIFGFFSEKDGAMTDTEKTLLSVNKAICNALRTQENEQLSNNSQKVDSDSGNLIRCKECRYKERKGMDYFCDHITGEEIMVSPNDYCSWAEKERRTDEQDD